MNLQAGRRFNLAMLSVLSLLLTLENGASELQHSNKEKYLNASGLALMQASNQQHRQYPYVYEEFSMVLIDRKQNRETRRFKLFSRIDDVSATDAPAEMKIKMLLLFDHPKEVNGVAVLADMNEAGEGKQYVFLPALGPQLVEDKSAESDAGFLGSDFSIDDLAGKKLDGLFYQRGRDALVDDAEYYVIDVFKMHDSDRKHMIHRHFMMQDNMYITRTDYYDDQNRLVKRQSHYDLTAVFGDMWRANMILMEDFQLEHQSLLKVRNRVFSPDYVKPEIFTAKWLFDNYILEVQVPEPELKVTVPPTLVIDT